MPGVRFTTILIPICLMASVFGRRRDDSTSNIFQENIDLDVTLQAVENARESIVNVTNVFWRANRTNLSAKFLRLAFHDAIGGMDGCVDLSRVDNFGLDIPINALKPTVTQYATPESGLSRADIWALAGLTGVEISQPTNKPSLKFPLQFIGRTDCDDPTTNRICRDENSHPVECAYNRGPHRDFPSPHLNTVELLHFFHATFGFSARQTVVIMGAHTIGFAKREHSGIDGPVGWVRDPQTFNNEYYRMLTGSGNCVGEYIDDAPNWSHKTMYNGDIVMDDDSKMPDQFMWVRPSGNSAETSDNKKSLIMTSSDMALVRTFTVAQSTHAIKCTFKRTEGCPFARSTGHIMVEYRKDNDAFMRDFRDTYNLMVTHGYNTTCDGLPSDGCTNYLTQIDFSITSSPTTPVPTSVPTSQPSAAGRPTQLPTGIYVMPPSTVSSGYLLGLAGPSIYSILIIVISLL